MDMTCVNTRFGPVRGLRCEDPTIVAFKGIPFAAPPVGDLRWQPPQSPVPWEDPLPCYAYAPIAMQPRHAAGSFAHREFYRYQPPRSEDCLYLNLWTPAQSAGEKLPVMVYLHGGANVQGYSCKMEAGGDQLCKQGVIYVCAAYRLGVFGFLAHPELSREQGHSGNYGLMDQLAALEWIRDNIAAFGGDPENITVFGQSAGGVDLLALLCSPRSRGLIHKGISQSAGGMRPVMDSVSPDAAEKQGLAFQAFCGCGDLSEMRSLDADALLDRAMEMDPLGYLSCRLFPMCADGYVLPDTLKNLLSRGLPEQIPLITGCTSDEGSLGFFDPREGLPYPALQDKIRETFGADASRAAEMYRPESETQSAACARQLWGDSMFLGCRELAKIREPLANTYLYYFNRQLPDADGISRNGAFHSADLWYTFGNVHRSWRPMTGKDFELARAMTGYWTNFAKTGDPNGPGLPHWPPFSRENAGAMILGETLGMDPMTDHRVVKAFG